MDEDFWFGIHVPPEGVSFDDVKRLCLEAETLGYDLFTVTDHFMNMMNPQGLKGHPLECWTLLSALASTSSRIKLGSLVTCYAYRHPTLLAKMATTVDIISKGRLIFGIGAGWHREEFRAFLGRFPPAEERLRGLEEALEICRSMFTREKTTYEGQIYRVEDVLNLPRPVQRPPPILVGGGGEKRTLRITAKHADISHFAGRDLESVDRKLRALRKHCEEVGRGYEEIRKGIGVRIVMGDKEETKMKLRRFAETIEVGLEEIKRRMRPLIGTSEEIEAYLDELRSRGIRLITLVFHDEDDIKLFAEEVMPNFR